MLHLLASVKNKPKKSLLNQIRHIRGYGGILLAFVLAFSLPVAVYADQFDTQIQQLQQQQSQAQSQSDQLGQEAGNIQAQIDTLENQIASVQAQIDANTAQYNSLTQQIAAAQAELHKQQGILGADIKAMYLQGQTSTIEMLASSQNLSSFLNQQQYTSVVKDEIVTTMGKIRQLREKLSSQQQQVTILLNQQKQLDATLAGQESQANADLAATNQQKAQFDASVANLSGQIATLRAEQAAALAAAMGSGGSSPVGGVITYTGLSGNVSACGGGYPAVYCNAPHDSLVDQWGLYNRECVSYVAWAEQYEYGHQVPDFNGAGNADQWIGTLAADGDAYADGNPTVGAAVYMPIGGVGHMALVNSVFSQNGQTWVYVSQYNFDMNLSGDYSTMDVEVTPNLQFIHFTH
ncbi:MAG TPA: CHAP domain-containing protein [Candidatus Saccharimonadales bacterium]|nr:CHAP domain-containing protein [Candidatus Saccharimonadales bacterium]